MLLGLVFLVFYVPGVARFCQSTFHHPPWTLEIPFFVIESPVLAGAFVLGGIGLVAWGGLRLWRSPRGESMMLRIPLLGGAIRSVLQARFLAVLGDLLAAGARPDDALSLAVAASGSRILADRSGSMCIRVRDGTAIPEVLRGSEVISPEIGDALHALGPEAAEYLAEVLLLRASAQSDALSSFLRPAAILAAGIIVGTGIVVSFWTGVETIL
jgi:type II secretory pathway component PulF